MKYNEKWITENLVGKKVKESLDSTPQGLFYIYFENEYIESIEEELITFISCDNEILEFVDENGQYTYIWIGDITLIQSTIPLNELLIPM